MILFILLACSVAVFHSASAVPKGSASDVSSGKIIKNISINVIGKDVVSLEINDITDPETQAFDFCARQGFDTSGSFCSEVRHHVEFIFYNHLTFEIGSLESIGFDIDLTHPNGSAHGATYFSMNTVTDPKYQARIFCDSFEIAAENCITIENQAGKYFRLKRKQQGIFNLPSDIRIGNITIVITEAGSTKELEYILYKDLSPHLNMRMFCVQHKITWEQCDQLNTRAENAYYQIMQQLPVGNLLISIPVTVINTDTSTEVELNIFDHLRVPVQVKRFCTNENLTPSLCSQLMLGVAGQVSIPPIRHLYMGTCRHNTLFRNERRRGFDVLPTRMLDNTRTFIYFLQNMKRFSPDYFEADPALSIDAFTELMFYDSNDAELYRNFWEFILYPSDYSSLENIIVEIASRKVYYWTFNQEKVPVSSMAVSLLGSSSLISRYNLSYHELTDEEISADLDHLQELIAEVFSSEVKLRVILHVDLRLIQTKEYIPKRHQLARTVEQLCVAKNISVFNPGKVLENNCKNVQNELFQNPNCEFLEYWLADGFHWSKPHDVLNSNIVDWIGR